MYSSSAKAYEANRKLLGDTDFTKVSDYFEANWHPIRHEWVACFANNFNFTPEPIIGWNLKIKSVCSSFQI